MARVKDLWVSEVKTKGAAGKTVIEKRKTTKHPDNGGNKSAKRWLACWTDPDGNEKTKAFEKKTAAENYAKKMEADAERGDYIEPNAGGEKFGPLARKFIRLQKITKGSRERYESVLVNHVDPTFEHRTVKGPRPSEIVEWIRGPLAPMSGSIQHCAFLIVRGTFDLAVADKLRRDNPARSPIVPVPRQDDPQPRAMWSTEIVWKIINEHPDQYRVIPLVEAALGLREGCAFAITEEDFDFAAMTFTVNRQVVRYDGQSYFKLPKGGKTRTVPLGRGAAKFVRDHIAKHPATEITLPWLNEDGTVADDPVTARLLVVWRGRGNKEPAPIIGQTYTAHVWCPALSRAGVAPAPIKDDHGSLRYKSGGRANGQHMLRHFFETMLDNGGVSLAGQMDFMGHSRKSASITLSVYSHVTEETFNRARDAVDRTMFKLRPVESDGTVTELRAAR